MDKLNLAALEATLRLYRDERRALASIPTLQMLTMSAEQLVRRAGMISRKLRKILPVSVKLVTHPGESSAGGGSFPLLHLPTTLIEVRIAGLSPYQIEEALRLAAVPVIGRIHRDRFLLDARTIMDRDLPALSASLRQAAGAQAEEPE
jgi:L-seryl-tRNA(Ser) seleniumtransferase